TNHTNFLLALANIKPELELLNQKTESLGNDVSRVTVTVHNKGLLPAVADIGARNYWVKLINVSLTLTKDQSLVSGNRVVVLNNLQPGESQEISWLIKGKGSATLEAGAPQTGFKKINITL
ncbi:MAG TPA: peptidase M14, partial [Cyclobacteriaceae bacterium]|nr:peptidase M14 [Cyclobacteriaceae bacterium]